MSQNNTACIERIKVIGAHFENRSNIAEAFWVVDAQVSGTSIVGAFRRIERHGGSQGNLIYALIEKVHVALQ